MPESNVPLQSRKDAALAHLQANRFAEARSLYAEICESGAADAESWFMLGALCGQLGQVNEAIRCCRKAIELQPDYVAAHYNLAQAYMHQQAFREATASYRELLRLQPGHADALNNLGYALQQQEQYEEAAACHREALRLRPQYLEALHNYGNALHGLGRLEEAVACFRQVLQFRPDYAEAHNDLGAVLVAMGLMQEAEHSYRRALQIRPDDAKTRHGLLVALNYHSDEPAQVFREHLAWAERQAATIRADSVHRNAPDPERRLRIGYLSPDFRVHSVAFFATRLFAHHDPQAVEVFCYANVQSPDTTTARFQTLCHHWRDIRALADDQAADLIRQDGIDILVDLAGHTAGNRLAVFARKPAPVQVTYLGYPNTTGLTAIDYRFTDAEADPPGTTEQWHTEKLVRLPHGFLCYEPPPNAPAVAPLPAATAGPVTFGSFNNLAKITPRVVALWARILRALPESRLVMKSRLLKEPATCDRVYRQFESHGIGRERVELISHVQGMANHLAYYHRLDLALDTFPYHGTTTTCEALWMGVPVITLEGRTHAGRVGVSLLTRIGLPDLIAKNEDDYVHRAVALARDLPRLTELRAGLRQRLAQSPLGDGPAFARDVEAAYREMWRGWCAGERKT